MSQYREISEGNHVKLRWKPNSKPQHDFVYDFYHAYCTLAGGYGGGKTFSLCLKAFMKSCLPNAKPKGFYEPDYPRITDVALPTFEKISNMWNIDMSYNRKTNRLRHRLMPKDCFIRMHSALIPSAIKGQEYEDVYVDEFALNCDESMRNIIARTRGNDKDFRQRNFAGTWEGRRGWGYDYIWKKKLNNSALYIVSSSDNSENVGNDYIENLKTIYSAEMIQQYMMGIPCDIGQGRVYYAFDEKKHVSTDAVYNHSLPIGIAKDFNVGKMVAIIIQWRRPDIINCIDEVVLTNSNTPEMDRILINRLKEIDANQKDIYLWGDASGNYRSSKSNKSDYDLTREKLKFEGYKLHERVPVNNPGIKTRYNTVNRIISGETKTKVLINPKCKDLIRDLNDVVYEKDRDEINKPKLEKMGLTHISDALGYMNVQEFPIFGGHYA